MLFDYSNFIQEERENPESKIEIEKYEECCGPLAQRPMENTIDPRHKREIPMTGEMWYRALVRPFPQYSNYCVPGELEDDFDWGLLAQLGAAAFSSKSILEIRREKTADCQIRLKINVESGGSKVIKYADELWGFQVIRLFEIWVQENINLFVLYYEDRREREAIRNAKQEQLKLWEKQLWFIRTFGNLDKNVG